MVASRAELFEIIRRKPIEVLLYFKKGIWYYFIDDILNFRKIS